MTKCERVLLLSATGVVTNLIETAARLRRAIEACDLRAISEIQLSTNSWTLERLRGAAWALLSKED